jgi:hypothetical protein
LNVLAAPWASAGIAEVRASSGKRLIRAIETAEVDSVVAIGKMDATGDMHLVSALLLRSFVEIIMLHRAPPTLLSLFSEPLKKHGRENRFLPAKKY